MTAVAVELLPAPPAEQNADAVELVADTDTLVTMCSCSAGDDLPY